MSYLRDTGVDNEAESRKKDKKDNACQGRSRRALIALYKKVVDKQIALTYTVGNIQK